MGILIKNKPLPRADSSAFIRDFNLKTKEKGEISSFTIANGKQTSKVSKINSNFIRSRLFNETAGRLYPDKKYITRYEKFLSESYKISLRGQLNRRFRSKYNSYTHVGYATGGLSKSIKAKAKVRISRDRRLGRIHINYRLEGLYTKYGEYLNDTRSPADIPMQVIRKWMMIKIRQGSFKMHIRKDVNNLPLIARKKGDVTSKQVYDRIAYKIQKRLKSKSSPPVLKDWSNFDKNTRLRIMFNKLVKRKGAYHRTQIRKSIINNINNG